ncbi:type II secretion system protein GspK [Aureliella helgolandensis]|nr:type II secretion system protein GspK [Aureliella helgolandensis]
MNTNAKATLTTRSSQRTTVHLGQPPAGDFGRAIPASGTHRQPSRAAPLRGRSWRPRRAPRRPAFILLLVLIVVVMASLAALNFSRSMLNSHESAQLSSSRLQARMCAESGAQAVRLFLSYTKNERLEQGGTWENDLFYARNVIPDTAAARRGNYTIISPALDEMGNYTGIRYGLQNESAKLNLNTLVQLDSLAASGDLAASATSELAGGDTAGLDGLASEAGAEDLLSGLASEATATTASSFATNMLLALPGMTEDIADAILDWIDEDDLPRPYGAEFDDYYSQVQTPYKPANGPIESIEQLLLVRGVTAELLFGYDADRNGFLDQAETTRMNNGMMAGAMPGQAATMNMDPNATPPPPLGWAQYLTLHSMEKNVDAYGLPRININGDDLETLYAELVEVLGNEEWASFIVAYRFGGKPGGNGSSPLVTLASMAAADSSAEDGALGSQLGSLQAAGEQLNAADQGQAQPWSMAAFDAIDLTQAGSVTFNQVLDVIDGTITLPQGNNEVTYTSPFASGPIELAFSTPLLMENLTTVDATAIPGRIDIMNCPHEILRGIPGLSDEIVDEILIARTDGSDSETRNYETWLVVEGLITMDEMRALLPLITCGGDVFKAQIVGYLEGSASFSRIEAIVSGAGDIPEILFFRRMDHLGRGFDIPTLGQRLDATLPGGSMMQ